MNTDSTGKIVEFEEKPKNAKSNKASMGVYIFTWEKLRHYLTADEEDKKSSNDFGKNIIPNMLNDKQVLMAYDFNGYWKDVGTIESLWEANMDLIDNPMPMDMHDKKWRIYSKNPGMPPHYIAEGAVVTNTLITEGWSDDERRKKRAGSGSGTERGSGFRRQPSGRSDPLPGDFRGHAGRRDRAAVPRGGHHRGRIPAEQV